MFKGGFTTRLRPKDNLIDLAPLVDVVFLLLIFFFVSSEILPLKSLPLTPPKLDIEASPVLSEIPIMMDQYGVIYVGSNKVVSTLLDLPKLLENEFKKDAKTIVLSVDETIPYGMFLTLFSSLHQTGHPIRLVFHT